MQADSTTTNFSSAKQPQRCIDCDKIISSYRALRCRGCAMKESKGRRSLAQRSRFLRPGEREAQSVRVSKALANPEIRKTLSRSSKAAKTPELRAALSLKLKEICGSDEKRKWRSEVTKRAWAEGKYANRDTANMRCSVSERMRIAWAEGELDHIHSEEWRQNAARKRKAAWAAGLYGNKQYRNKLSIAASARWANGKYDGVFNSPTSIELAVSAALDQLGVGHKSQHRPIGCKYIFDEYIEPDILIEIHGGYWHADPRQYDRNDLTNRRLKTVWRDEIKAKWAEDNGYQLIVIWELEFKLFGADVLVSRALALVGREAGRCKEIHS